jgi:urocanate hydratase
MTTSGAHNTAAYQPVRAPLGAALCCQGWQQEAVLRMLLNSLDPEVAERPQDLLISGAEGKAAADWESVHAIVNSLRQLETAQTLLVESGKPAGISRTTPLAPRVLVTNTALGETFGDWLQAGTQSALPLLYEIYAEAARRHFDGTLAGKLVVGAGIGGALPLAATLHGAAFLGIDADADRIKRRVKTGYCEVMVNNLDEALRMLKNAVRQRKSASIGLIGDCATVLGELAQRGVVPDLLADQQHPAAQLSGLGDLEKLGARIVNPATALDYLRPFFDHGWRLSTWIALSGEPADVARTDRLALELFPADERIQRWLAVAGKYVRFQGLPARVTWMQPHELGQLARAANDLVARGEISAPVLFGRRAAPADPQPPTENGSCWTWTADARPGSVRPPLSGLSAQAAVADGTADADARLSSWTDA